MEADLSNSPHQKPPLHYGNNGEAQTMLRRAAGKKPHICIVGAGVAGLRCADVLVRHGAKVTLIEGRDRVGGRLCQSTVNGHMVDLGPNWIHGTDNNPILDLARETQTTTMSWDGRQVVFDRHGERLADKEAAEDTELMWTVIEKAMRYSNAKSAEIAAERSLFDFFGEELAGMISGGEEEKDGAGRIEGIDGEEKEEGVEGREVNEGRESKKDRKKQQLLDLSEMWGAFVGSPIQTQSLRFFWLEECIDGENLFVAETYHKILAKIAERGLDGAELLLNTKVVKIISDAEAEAEEPRVRVVTDDGEIREFDEVVMTAPLGWLKRNADAFEPALPRRLTQAIDAIGYGHLDKVYITFPTPFWNTPPNPTPSTTAIPPMQHIPNVTATTAPLNQSQSQFHSSTSTTHENGHENSTYFYPGFTHWTAPSYSTPTNPQRWNQECVNLAALPSPTSHPTLLFYTHGPTSLHLASLLSAFPSPSHPCAQKLLAEFFAPYYSLLPNYSPTNPEHQPIALLATAWANDELAGYGSYANFQTGLERGDEDVEVMREGLPGRGVWLAGEHTAPFVALGTVTGAYWAGEGVGRRIVGGYGLVEREDGRAGESEKVA